MAPVLASRYSTFAHVRPPSSVRNTPRCSFGPYACPSAATSATSGSRGSTRMRPICRVSSRPTCVQCAPPSVVRYTPSPYVWSDRMSASPVPTHTTRGSDGATASAPTDGFTVSGHAGSHVSPAFSVFHTPPATAPNQNVRGSPATPDAASARPARNGPIMRQRRAE